MMSLNGGLVVVKSEPDHYEEEYMETNSQGGDSASEVDSADGARSITTEEVKARQKLHQFQKMGMIEVEVGEKGMEKSLILSRSGELPAKIQLFQQIRAPTSDIQTHILNHAMLDPNNYLEIQNSIPSNSLSTICQNEAETDVPNLTPDTGNFGFEVYLEDKEDTLKSPTWLMSKLANKLYININKPVPFHVRLTKQIPMVNFNIRVMAVFNSHQFLRTIVSRCPNHSNPSDQTNIDVPHVDHVVRVDHPQATYEKSSNGRLSVVIPLELIAGGNGDASPILVKFMCLNSCVGGINRRPLAVMFTLEHNNATVGRHVIDVRVCACPTRDFKNDESSIINKGSKRATGLPTEYKLGKKKLKSSFKGKEEENDMYFLPIRGFQLYEYLKEMKSLYLRHHPEYAERYPDLDDDSHDRFMENFLKEYQQRDMKEAAHTESNTVTVSKLNNTTQQPQFKFLYVDQPIEHQYIASSSSSTSSTSIIKTSESDHELIAKSNSYPLINKSKKIIANGTSNGDIHESISRSASNSVDKITITKSYATDKMEKNTSSLQRHLPFVSVTPYLPGSTVLPKSKKLPENGSVKNKHIDMYKMKKDTDVNIKIEPGYDKISTVTTNYKDELMAAQLLASNLGATPPEIYEAIDKAMFEESPKR